MGCCQRTENMGRNELHHLWSVLGLPSPISPPIGTKEKQRSSYVFVGMRVQLVQSHHANINIFATYVVVHTGK